MEIITIASAKGGVSKSLLAINLFDYLKNEEENRELFKSEGVAVINSTLSNSVVYVNSINDLKPIFRTKHTKQKIELTKFFR